MGTCKVRELCQTKKRNNYLYPKRWYLNNWRPITLLNIAYKISYECNAQRIKNMLDIISSPFQTDFIPGRYIGENTKLIYDLMQHMGGGGGETFLVYYS